MRQSMGPPISPGAIGVAGLVLGALINRVPSPGTGGQTLVFGSAPPTTTPGATLTDDVGRQHRALQAQLDAVTLQCGAAEKAAREAGQGQGFKVWELAIGFLLGVVCATTVGAYYVLKLGVLGSPGSNHATFNTAITTGQPAVPIEDDGLSSPIPTAPSTRLAIEDKVFTPKTRKR